MLSRRLRQTYSALSREIHPERAKIKREILLALKKDGRVSKDDLEKYGLVFLQPAQSPRGRNDLPPIPYEILSEIGWTRHLRGLQVPKFLRRLAEELSSHYAEELSARCLPPGTPPPPLPPVRLHDLINLYEEIQGLPDFLLPPSSPFSSPFSSLSRSSPSDPARPRGDMPLLSWLDEAMSINAAILERYRQKGKISAREKTAYQAALREMIADLSDGGKERSIYAYLERHLGGIDRRTYRQERRAILEYLWRKSRVFMQEKLERWQISAK